MRKRSNTAGPTLTIPNRDSGPITMQQASETSIAHNEHSELCESMTSRVQAHRDEFHTLGNEPAPQIVVEIAVGRVYDLVWRNELGGLTFRIEDEFLKWSPRSTGVDLEREVVRLEWLLGRHPAPRVLAWGADDDAQWLHTAALPGEHAVGAAWRARSSEAISAIGHGLRAIHAVSIDEFPVDWTEQSWVSRTPDALEPRPPVDHPVLVHGDACAPNTLISTEGLWTGHVDFGALAVGDRWADLAIASLSLDWNFGEGRQHELFTEYGIEPDERRIRYYRDLWKLES